MKTAAVLLAGTLLLAMGSLKAQPYFSNLASHEKANLDQVEKYYLECLKSSNEGVIESGLAHVARMKLYYPERPFAELEKQIVVLSAEGPTAGLRYRAYLVRCLFSTPSVFTVIAHEEYAGPEELFAAISSRLQATLLGSSETERSN